MTEAGFTPAPETSSSAEDANKQISADTSPAGDKGETEAVKDEPKSLLDVVKDVVNDESAGAAEDRVAPDLEKTDSKATDADADSQKPVDDGTKASSDEAEDAKLPFHKHPRFQKVIHERSTFKKELETLKPDAEEWRAVKTFMDTNALTPDEVAKGFQIMAAMKNDPIRARDMLASYWGKLEEFAGAKLPEDLKEKVDQGEVDEAVASELARRRNEADFLRAQQYMAEQRKAEASLAEQQAQHQSMMRSTVIDWENGIKTRDADYSVKQPFLLDKVRAAMAQTPPQTPQDAVALVEQAYREVNDSLKRFVPNRPAANTLKSETSSANVRPEPKSLRDAVRLAAAGQI